MSNYLQLWKSLSGPRWTSEPNVFLPKHYNNTKLVDLFVSECSVMPEVFYTQMAANGNDLPVITPLLAKQFMNIVPPNIVDIVLWTWCSGTSKLAYTATCLPFCKAVLFPIDLRYGWDISCVEHQQLLVQLDALYRPAFTTFEMRGKGWSRSKSDQEVQNLEAPMLNFMTMHSLRLIQDKRHGIFECARNSEIWRKSPISSLGHSEQFHCDTVTSFCAFAPEQDGRRHERSTRLKSSLNLTKAVRQCNCVLGHVQLSQLDDKVRKSKLVEVTCYSRRFCLALCEDMLHTYKDMSRSFVIASSSHESKVFPLKV